LAHANVQVIRSEIPNLPLAVNPENPPTSLRNTALLGWRAVLRSGSGWLSREFKTNLRNLRGTINSLRSDRKQ
jgi:hypothetical protein